MKKPAVFIGFAVLFTIAMVLYLSGNMSMLFSDDFILNGVIATVNVFFVILFSLAGTVAGVMMLVADGRKCITHGYNFAAGVFGVFFISTLLGHGFDIDLGPRTALPLIILFVFFNLFSGFRNFVSEKKREPGSL